MKIKWSKQAEIVLDEVIQYGELTFGTKATTKLILRIEQCCSLLAIYPVWEISSLYFVTSTKNIARGLSISTTRYLCDLRSTR